MDWIFEIVLFAVICRLVWLYWTWDFNVSDIETDTEPLDRHDIGFCWLRPKRQSGERCGESRDAVFAETRLIGLAMWSQTTRRQNNEMDLAVAISETACRGREG